MNSVQWEQLCMRCGRCCLKKFSRDGKTVFTRIACFKLSVENKTCTNYVNRQRYVADCKQMSSGFIPEYMPSTCSYVRYANNLPPATMEEVDELYPWDNVVSERELMKALRFEGFRMEDYELI